MSSQDEVSKFLKEFKTKKDIWQILFRDDRGKNTQTLADLEISSSDREKVIDALKTEDYSEGPLEDTLNKGAKMWVFGKQVKDAEVYIKITLGWTNSSVCCISFHIAEHKIIYPFKK